MVSLLLVEINDMLLTLFTAALHTSMKAPIDTAEEASRVVETHEVLNQQEDLSAPSPFVSKLPPEIRNLIYGLVLVVDKPIGFRDKQVLDIAALLQTCSQIRHEALSMFLASNDFHIEIEIRTKEEGIIQGSKGWRWLQGIGLKQANSIQNAIICLTYTEIEEVVADMEAANRQMFRDKLRFMSGCPNKIAKLMPRMIITSGVPTRSLQWCWSCVPNEKTIRDGLHPNCMQTAARCWCGTIMGKAFTNGKENLLREEAESEHVEQLAGD